MSRKNGVSWIKKSEPKFIREFKERVAYKERASVETKKKKLDEDYVPEEKEEDQPQIVQLKSGDLGEKEYQELRDKDIIANSASSFGKILFKKPQKKVEQQEPTDASVESAVDEKKEKICAELDSIFNLTAKGDEKKEKDENEEKTETEESAKGTSAEVTEKDIMKQIVEKKKIYLEDEENETKSFGLQPAAKKRFIDRISASSSSSATHLTPAQVLAREKKPGGNKKLLSFYDEEQEENDDE